MKNHFRNSHFRLACRKQQQQLTLKSGFNFDFK